VRGLVVEVNSLVETATIAQDLAREIAQCCVDHCDPLPLVFRRPISSKLIELVIPVELP
jgi:hypothetical protein